MKISKMKKIVMGLTLTVFGIPLVIPSSVLAVDLADDEIQIVEFRDCTDTNAGWTDSELSSKIVLDDGTQNCYFRRSASYSMTSLHKEGMLNTSAGNAFRLNAKLFSPATNRLDLTTSTLKEDDTAKCKVDSDLFSSDGMRAGLGAILNEIMSDSKVTSDEYYYGSLAMSQFIYDKTKKTDYRVTNVLDSLYTNYLTLAEEGYDKATTSASATIDGKEITEFDMEYAQDGTGNDYIWKSSEFITFEDMRYFTTLIDDDFSSDIFQYELTNVTNGKDYSDFVYAAIQKEDEDTGNDLVYQFGICNSKSFQVNTYDNCRSLKGQELPAGDYELTVIVKDTIAYNKMKTIYSCSSTKYSSNSYTPVALAGNNLSSAKNAINYTLTSSFTIAESTGDEDTGSIHVSTIDESSKETVKDAVFKLCTTSGCSNTIKTSSNGKISLSPIATGEYYLVVTSVPSGYIKPNARKINITKGNTYEEDIVLTKEINSGSVNITAVDSNDKTLTGAKIKLCATSDCKDGELYSSSGNLERSSIPFGTYYVVVDVPNGYVTPSTIDFTLSSTNSSYSKTIKIEAKTTVPDTLSNVSKIFIACGIVGIIAGVYLVFTNAKKQKQI